MIRLATIGTNFITDWFMEGVQELEEIKLTAVYSRNLEKGKQFAAKYGVEKVYNNYEEMAQDPGILYRYRPEETGGGMSERMYRCRQ